MDRRLFLKSAAAVTLHLSASSRVLRAQQAAPTSRRLANGIEILNVRGTNVLSFRMVGGVGLVDSGPPKTEDQILAMIKSAGGDAKVEVLFNTHYHTDQTGNNEVFAAAGARIIAHLHTRHWMSTDYWVPAEDRWEKARPKAAWPTETFRTASSFSYQRLGGVEEIEYGHLPLAHTDGDIYVLFKTSNVLVAGGVASPVLDPALDWFTGAWIGGRLDAMDTILKLSDEQTAIVPSNGPVMSRAEFKEERDMMEEVRSRIWKRTLQGDSPREMLEAGVLDGLLRSWRDPYKFLFDAAQGMFAHHNKLDPSVV